MKGKSKEKMRLLQAMRNNIYVMKLGNEISRSRVIHAFVTKVFFTLNGSLFVTLEMVFSAWISNHISAKNLPKVRQKVKLTLYEKASEMDLNVMMIRSTIISWFCQKQINRCYIWEMQ
ncbi:MAG: hypothetical protein K2N44_05805 [Lachnospiraceae bacterium]|nr:hypothetical protein [Lachnospiraceae bacterium]